MKSKICIALASALCLAVCTPILLRECARQHERQMAQRVVVDATIIRVYESAWSGNATLIELPDRNRQWIRGVWGNPGETLRVTLDHNRNAIHPGWRLYR